MSLQSCVFVVQRCNLTKTLSQHCVFAGCYSDLNYGAIILVHKFKKSQVHRLKEPSW